jgi:nucleotide-binding universal stress UspA family protein
VFHAVEWPLGTPPYMTFGTGRAAIQGVLDSRDRALKTAHDLVERVAARLRAHGFPACTSIREDDARSAIVDAAISWKADLIVMGSHGRRGLDRSALGSVAESVMRRAPCSVEIIRASRQSATTVTPAA